MSYRLVAISNMINQHIQEVCGRKGYEFDNVILDEFLHTYGVSYFAALLAHQRGLNVEIAGIIGLLHDSGRIIDGILDDSHGSVGAEEAEQLLRRTKMFSEEEIVTVCMAIRTHSDKEVIGNKYQEIIKDADAFERLISLTNWGKPLSLRRQRLDNIIQSFGLRQPEGKEAN